MGAGGGGEERGRLQRVVVCKFVDNLKKACEKIKTKRTTKKSENTETDL